MVLIYYNKLLMGCLTGSFTYEMIPDRYKLQVKAKADADLESGALPEWQYNLMGFPVGK